MMGGLYINRYLGFIALPLLLLLFFFLSFQYVSVAATDLLFIQKSLDGGEFKIVLLVLLLL